MLVISASLEVSQSFQSLFILLFNSNELAEAQRAGGGGEDLSLLLSSGLLHKDMTLLFLQVGEVHFRA